MTLALHTKKHDTETKEAEQLQHECRVPYCWKANSGAQLAGIIFCNTILSRVGKKVLQLISTQEAIRKLSQGNLQWETGRQVEDALITLQAFHSLMFWKDH